MGGGGGQNSFEPHNPRTTATKGMMNIASAIPGGGVYFAVLLGFRPGFDNSYTTPLKTLF